MAMRGLIFGALCVVAAAAMTPPPSAAQAAEDLGSIKGHAEPLSGLARAFFYAGARALLVSHWPVNSQAAVELTTKSINTLKENPELGRAEALRQAMLSLIDHGTAQTANPAYWAPFVVIGGGGR